MSKNKPINQHYISKFYLKRFFCPEISQNSNLDKNLKEKANQKHKFKLYAYPEFQEKHLKNPVELNSESKIFKNNGFEQYFYSDEEDLNKEDGLEYLIGQKEDVWSNMIDKINLNHDINFYKRELIEFVFLNGIKSLYSNNYLKEYAKHYFDISQETAKLNIINSIGFDFYNENDYMIATNNNRNFFEQEIIKNRRNSLKSFFTTELELRDWEVNVYNSNTHIVLNDSPFLCANLDGTLKRNYDPKICHYIMYPLNYKKMIIIYNKRNKFEYLDNMIENYNQFFIFNYYKFLWSSNAITKNERKSKITEIHKVHKDEIEILVEKLIKSYINSLLENNILIDRIVYKQNRSMPIIYDTYIQIKKDNNVDLYYYDTFYYLIDQNGKKEFKCASIDPIVKKNK